jgi:hypothetical protein
MTRWNSTYFELLNLLGLWIAFEAFIREERIEAEAIKKAPKSDWPEEEDHARNAILKDKTRERRLRDHCTLCCAS